MIFSHNSKSSMDIHIIELLVIKMHFSGALENEYMEVLTKYPVLYDRWWKKPADDQNDAKNVRDDGSDNHEHKPQPF